MQQDLTTKITEAQSITHHKQQSPFMVVNNWLQDVKPQLEMVLPSHIKSDRIIRLTLNVIRNNPKILNCTPQSIIGSVMKCAELGLDPGVLNQAHIVPFGKEAQFVIGYEGLIGLMYRNGRVGKVFANCVHENDKFNYKYGTDETFEHIPAFENRGEVILYYAYVKLKGNDYSIYYVMSKQDALHHGKKYSKTFNSNYSPWQTSFHEMAMKTCIKKMQKFVPKSIEYRDIDININNSDNTIVTPENQGIELELPEIPKIEGGEDETI